MFLPHLWTFPLIPVPTRVQLFPTKAPTGLSSHKFRHLRGRRRHGFPWFIKSEGPQLAKCCSTSALGITITAPVPYLSQAMLGEFCWRVRPIILQAHERSPENSNLFAPVSEATWNSWLAVFWVCISGVSAGACSRSSFYPALAPEPVATSAALLYRMWRPRFVGKEEGE